VMSFCYCLARVVHMCYLLGRAVAIALHFVTCSGHFLYTDTHSLSGVPTIFFCFLLLWTTGEVPGGACGGDQNRNHFGGGFPKH